MAKEVASGNRATKRVSGHKIRESRHKNEYLATRSQNRAIKTSIWPQDHRIAPQKQVSGHKRGESRHKNWNLTIKVEIEP
jgi:hypothetical protein